MVIEVLVDWVFGVDLVVGVDVCGFLVVVVVVIWFEVGVLVVCKGGKLFWLVFSEEYYREYGVVILEIFVEGIEVVGCCVVIIDDVLVIGGIIGVM